MNPKKMIYSLDVFTKCKLYNHQLPEILNSYKHNSDDFWRKKHICSLNSSEIRAHLNAFINKRNVDCEDETLYDKIQGLLNKLSNNNFNDIGAEIKTLPYLKKKHIYKLCESIILKSINEPSFCLMYAKLCYILLPYYIVEQVTDEKLEKRDEKIYFRLALMTIMQDIFGELTNSNKINNMEYNRTIDYSKLKLSGLMKFLSELYNCDVLHDKIVEQCFKILYTKILSDANDETYEAFNVFVITYIKKLRTQNSVMFNKMKSEIETIANGTKEGFKFPKLINKFKIMEIMEIIDK